MMMMMRWPMASGFVVSSQYGARSPATQRSFFECCLKRVRSRFGTTLVMAVMKGCFRIYLIFSEWWVNEDHVVHTQLKIVSLKVATCYTIFCSTLSTWSGGGCCLNHVSFCPSFTRCSIFALAPRFINLSDDLGCIPSTFRTTKKHRWPHGPTMGIASRQSVALIPGILWTASYHTNGGWNCPWGSHKCMWGGRSLGAKCWGKFGWMLKLLMKFETWYQVNQYIIQFQMVGC